MVPFIVLVLGLRRLKAPRPEDLQPAVACLCSADKKILGDPEVAQGVWIPYDTVDTCRYE